MLHSNLFLSSQDILPAYLYFCVKFPSYKDTGHIGLKVHLTAVWPHNLISICKWPDFQMTLFPNPILRFWGLETQHINGRGINQTITYTVMRNYFLCLELWSQELLAFLSLEPCGSWPNTAAPGTLVMSSVASRQSGGVMNQLSFEIQPLSSFVNMCHRVFGTVIANPLLSVGGTIK